VRRKRGQLKPALPLPGRADPGTDSASTVHASADGDRSRRKDGPMKDLAQELKSYGDLFVFAMLVILLLFVF
jgi:hypothetical protein